MQSTGFVRRLDLLGRITIPAELRKKLNIDTRDAVEIFLDNETLVLRKYEPCDMFTGEMDELIEFHGKQVSKKTIKRMAEIAGLEFSND